MSETLIKLVDKALLPAALLVVGKFIGLAITIFLFQLPWELEEISNTIFSIRPAFLPEDLAVASSYSDLIMYLIIATGFSLVLVQATHFHETHIKPGLLIKLSNNNLLGLVRSSFDIYHAAAIWLLFIWLAVGVIWVDVILGKTFLTVGIATLVANIVFTTLLLQDVYREIELSKKNLGKQQALG